MSSLNISLEDVTIAYRKAKVDAFYESGHNTSIAFAEYEANLLENLQQFQRLLNSEKLSWTQNSKFLGSFAFLLKSVKKENERKSIYFSNSEQQWSKDGKASVDFRIIGQHSVNFHILSSLWIDKVGYKLETNVSENSYGCRLKRPYQTRDSFINNANGNVRPQRLQLGHFRNYNSDYKKWQRNGINAIKNTFGEEPRIVVSTFDLRKYYHRIDPDFLLDETFTEDAFKKEHSAEDRKLTEILVLAIKHWSRQTISSNLVPREFKMNGHCGIPLGLGASKVIANLLLISFDSEIEEKLKPIFYGRYVDDFFIVMRDRLGEIETTEDLWNHVSRKINGLYSKRKSKTKESRYLYASPYSKKTLLEFARDKEKVFVVEGPSGEALIEKIQNDLDENSSEWKMLPDAEENLDELTKEILASSSDESDRIPSLRKTDSVSIQRLKFALRLRDFEAMVGLTPNELWEPGLLRFFRLSKDIMFAASNIPIYQKYYPRVIRLAIKAEKYEEFEDLIKRHTTSWQFLKRRAKSDPDKLILGECQKYANKLIAETIANSLPLDRTKLANRWIQLSIKVGLRTNRKLLSTSEKLYFADLHSTPFRKSFLEQSFSIPRGWGREMYDLKKLSNVIDSSLLKLGTCKAFIRDLGNSKNIRRLITADRQFVPKSLFFYTRPFNMLEITFLFPDWSEVSRLKRIKRFLSLFDIPEIPTAVNEIQESTNNISQKYLLVPSITNPNHASFALTSFKTETGSWIANVCDRGEPDRTRYPRIFSLVNEVLRRKETINYLVFPELSIPRNIIVYLAGKLKTKNISLIAGVEYEKRSSGRTKALDVVSNQLIYILTTKANGRLEQILISQDKVEPAVHEKSDLRKFGKKKLIPKSNDKFIINHGGFTFSGLICNDFLNIQYREWLRGLIDALVIVEWNPDVTTYDSLVQSTSNDLHCFVMQVNNRIYGDTRMRAPYKEVYMRDVVRIRGGEFDYFVLTTLDVEGIRKFQKRNPSPKKPFKPVPTGYKISKDRRN